MRYQRTDNTLGPILLSSRMRDAIEAVADDRLPMVRELAPYRTGRLQENIKVRGGNPERIAGAMRVTCEIYVDVPYASYQEWGTDHNEARHYLALAARRINDRKGKR